MSLFQCDKCGCAENTACGWYHCRFSERLTKPDAIGKALCSACAPQTFPSGEPTKFNGKWHGEFPRTFLPKGSCFTNAEGNLEHKELGLVGNKLYDHFNHAIRKEDLTND